MLNSFASPLPPPKKDIWGYRIFLTSPNNKKIFSKKFERNTFALKGKENFYLFFFNSKTKKGK